MRYLILSDIHANLEALEAVLEDAPPYDAVLFLGDLIGYGPNPNECVDRVRELPNLTSLVGNHDLAALDRIDLALFNPDARRAAEWTGAQLRPDVREYLNSLEAKLETPEFALAHGSPRDPIWEYLIAPQQGPPNFQEFEGSVCFVGHTHVPRTFEKTADSNGGKIRVSMPEANEVSRLDDDSRRILNPGGVGQPRNGDARAAYGLWDTDDGTFTFRRVSYPVPVTQRKILEAGLPDVLAYRLQLGL